MAGGWRSGRERKVRASPDPRGAAVALERAVGSQPREPESAAQAVPAEMAPRNLRRVIPAPGPPILDRSSKSALAPLVSIEGKQTPGPHPYTREEAHGLPVASHQLHQILFRARSA